MFRIDIDKADHLPTIPVTPMSFADAYVILRYNFYFSSLELKRRHYHQQMFSLNQFFKSVYFSKYYMVLCNF